MKHKLIDFFSISIITLITLAIGNYKYAVGDQIIHLPFVKSLLNSQLYTDDTLVNIIKDKPTFFWQIFVWLFQLIGLEKGMFILQFVSLFVFLLSVKLFSQIITNNKWASYLSMLLFISPKYSFGYSSLFVTSSFIPRNFTIGPIILCIVLYLRKQKLWCYFILGILANLHIISVIPVIVSLIVFDFISYIKSRLHIYQTFLKLFTASFIFLLGMAPLLIKYKDFANNNSNANLDEEYIDFYNSVLTPFYEVNTIDGYLLIFNAVLIILLAYAWLTKTNNLTTEKRLLLATIVTVSTLLVLLSVIIENYLQKPFLLQLQIGRSGAYSVLVFTTLLSYILVRLIQNAKSITVAITSILVSAYSPLVSPLFLLEAGTKIRAMRYKKIAYTLIVAIFAMWINISTFKDLKDLKPQITLDPPINDNVKAQLWLKQNSMPDAKILAPYYIGGFTEPDFRTVSERTNVLTNADIVETILNVDLLPKTKDKLNDLTLGNYNLLMKDDNLFDYKIGRSLYHNAVKSNLNYLVTKYKVDYLIIESDFNIVGKNPIFENDSYKIYYLPIFNAASLTSF